MDLFSRDEVFPPVWYFKIPLSCVSIYFQQKKNVICTKYHTSTKPNNLYISTPLTGELTSQIPERTQVKSRDGDGVWAGCQAVSSHVLSPEDVGLGLPQLGVVADNPGHPYSSDGVKLIQAEPRLGELAILVVEPVTFLQSLELVPLNIIS